MPQGDKTGPFGLGPGTGRERGPCGKSLFSRGTFSTKRFGFLYALVPVVAAVIRDAVNPNGLLRSFSRKLLDTRNAARNQKRDAVEAKYTVIDEKKI